MYKLHSLITLNLEVKLFYNSYGWQLVFNTNFISIYSFIAKIVYLLKKVLKLAVVGKKKKTNQILSKNMIINALKNFYDSTFFQRYIYMINHYLRQTGRGKRWVRWPVIEILKILAHSPKRRSLLLLLLSPPTLKQIILGALHTQKTFNFGSSPIVHRYTKEEEDRKDQTKLSILRHFCVRNFAHSL